jgi:hypothetical protein
MGLGTHVRRLAHRQDHGPAHHQAQAGGRLLRRNRRRDHPVHLATGLGIPVSTTHTITGAIVGVGLGAQRPAVRWGVAGNIVWAWIFTIPQPAQPVAEAVQVEAVQPQRPSQKGEPSRQCLVFHAVIIAAKSCHPGPETAPSAPRQASGRISSRRRRARPHAENPERDARRSSRCCPSRR